MLLIKLVKIQTENSSPIKLVDNYICMGGGMHSLNVTLLLVYLIFAATRTNLIPSHSCKPLVKAVVDHSNAVLMYLIFSFRFLVRLGSSQRWTAS